MKITDQNSATKPHNQFANNSLIIGGGAKNPPFQQSTSPGLSVPWQLDVFKRSCLTGPGIHQENASRAVDFLSEIKNNQLEEFQLAVRILDKSGNYILLSYIGGAPDFNNYDRSPANSGLIKVVEKVDIADIIDMKNQKCDKALFLEQKKEQELLRSIFELVNSKRGIAQVVRTIKDRISNSIHYNSRVRTKFDQKESRTSIKIINQLIGGVLLHLSLSFFSVKVHT